MLPRMVSRLALVLFLTSCTFTFDRELGPGEIRARLVLDTDAGQRPAEGAQGSVAGTRLVSGADARGLVVFRSLSAGQWTVRFSLDVDGVTYSVVVRDVELGALRDGVVEARDLGTLVLRRLGSIEGVVTLDGQPIEGAVVSGDGLARAVTSEEGRYRIEFVAPGSHALSVAYGTGDDARVFSEQAVTVAPSKLSNADIALEGLASHEGGLVTGVAIQLGNPDYTGIHVWLESPAHTEALGTTDSDGRYTSAGDVPAGWYVVHAQATDGAVVSRDVLVAGGDELPPLYLPLAARMDLDGDGVVDEEDNCPVLANADQTDVDVDGVGDLCDDKPWAPADSLRLDAPVTPAKTSLPLSFTVTALDVHGNTVEDWQGPVEITTTDPQAILPLSVVFDAGVAIFSVTFLSPGIHDVTVTESVPGGLTVTQPGPPMSVPLCGDGELDTHVGETCDDGNAVTEDCDWAAESCVVCTSNCKEGAGGLRFCTDGVHEPAFETCDDGNDDDVDLCTNACLPAVCGDGFLNPGERCDDGNADDTDGCDSLCRLTHCDGVELFPTTAPTQLLTVTSLNDAGAGSLRQALVDAPEGALIRVSVEGTITLASELVVDRTVTIEGPGSTKLTVSAAQTGRVLRVASTGKLHLSGVTLSDGNLTCGTACVPVPGKGAGLYNEGEAVLYDVAIADNNIAFQGWSGVNVMGGGIFNAPAATLVLSDASVTNNIGDYRTGDAGLSNEGAARICRTSFMNNRLIDSGGAGAIGSTGDLVILDSLFANNQQPSDAGGALHVAAGTASVSGTTFVGNLGGYGGGGLRRTGGTLVVDRCTVVGNTSPSTLNAGAGLRGDMTVSNTIVAGNTGQSAQVDDVFGTFTSLGNNLIGATDGATGWSATDLTGSVASPLAHGLTTLADHGGRLAAMLPTQASPALDAGNLTAVPDTDVRGRPRVVVQPDLGAAEAALPRASLSLERTVGDELTATVTVTPHGLGTTVELRLSHPAGSNWEIYDTKRVGNGLAPVTLQWNVVGLLESNDASVRVVATNSDGQWIVEETAPAPELLAN